MKRLWLLAVFLALTPARAQQVPATANLTAQDTAGTCTTANACLSVNVPANNASALIQLSGTWSATVQFEASTGQGPNGSPFTSISGSPVAGGTAVSSANGNGAWRFNVASVYVIRVRVSSFVSGPVAAAITSSGASAFSSQNFGGGGGTGTIGGSGTACAIPVFTDASDIGNSNATDCNNIFLSTDPVSQPASLYPCPNSASGTTNGLLVTTDSNGNCINIANGQTTNIVGIAFSGGGTAGTVQVCQIGTCPVILDNQSVIGDCIVPGATGAKGHDSGTANCPSGVEQIGRATSLNSGAATAANARVFISDVISQSQGQAQVIEVNGTTIAGTNANLNATTPAAQTNNQNLVFQTDNATPTSNISVEAPLATTSQVGLIELAQDLCGTDLLPVVCGIQQKAVTFANIAARDVLCFVTTSNIANCPLGVPIRSVSGNSDTILASDRTSNVRYVAASGATAVTLAQAGSTGFANNFTMVVTNAQSSGAVTITPTTSTINGASTLVVASGTYCFIYSDNTNYFANCGQTGGGGAITGSGTNNTVTKWTGASTIGNSSVTDDGTNPTRGPNGLNTGPQGNYDEWTVDTGGVTANKLACRSSNNKAQICATSTTTGVLGVALTTQTSGQTVSVCWAAHCSVIPTNNTTSGHWLIPSTTVAGDVDDTGSTTQPTGTQTFLAETSVTAPAVVATTILSPDAIAAASGGKPNTTEINGTVDGTVTNFNSTTPAASAGHLNLPWTASTSANTTSAAVSPAVSGSTSTLATAGTMSGVANALLCDDGSKNITTSSCAASASQIPSSIRTRGLVFSYGDPGNASQITAGNAATDYMTVPFACTISAYNIAIDAGTVTIKFWKVGTGTAIPTSGNSISTSGVSISSGTAIHSTTVTDFTTTTVSANDIMAMNVSTVATAKFVTATLECDQ